MNNFQLKSSGKLSKPWLRLKLKYDDLFHRLSYGPKMAVNMGPMSPVTVGAVLEVRLTVKLSISFRFCNNFFNIAFLSSLLFTLATF